MPICKKCNTSFPNTTIIDGVRRNSSTRKYCYVCSPFGKHNTKQIDKSGDCKCSVCGREYIFDRKKGHTRHKCNSCMANDRRKEVKKRCLEYKGGKCVDCGYSGNDKVLSFHHLDHNEKEFQISGSHGRSWDSIRRELDKCVLLCANCHIIRHDEESNTPIAQW